MSWEPRGGTVYVVGAGPGDPDLLTVRARRVLERAGTVLYADSLVDPRLLGTVRADAIVRGTSRLTLEPIVAQLIAAARRGEVVARLHSGDPGVYGAVAEQLARLDGAGVPWEVVPGVPSPMAAAAALGCELTRPGTAQAVIFCRVAGRTAVPDGQDLSALARPGLSLCIFLSAAYGAAVARALREAGIADDTPAVIAERVSWPDERFSRGCVGDLERRLRDLGVRRHALILVGPAFGELAAAERSSLYDPAHAHAFRTGGTAYGLPRERTSIAVYALTRAGAAVGARLAAAIAGARLHLPARLAPLHPGAVAEEVPARAAVARLMAAHGGVILVMASGAAVRLAAPHLEDKRRDPALVAVDDAGRWAVPLAGAHEGGGNALAQRVAAVLGATAVVTTASTRRALVAPDELARSMGWQIENPRAVAAVTAALLDDEPVGLCQEAGRALHPPAAWRAALRPVASAAQLHEDGFRAALLVSDRLYEGSPGWLVLRPPSLLLGVGCEAGVGTAEVALAVDEAMAAARLATASVAGVATITAKLSEPGLTAFCAGRGWPLRGVGAQRLRTVAVPNPSALVAAAVGTPSVAEAAALVAAGPAAELLVPKQVRGRVTVAVARRSWATEPAA